MARRQRAALPVMASAGRLSGHRNEAAWRDGSGPLGAIADDGVHGARASNAMRSGAYGDKGRCDARQVTLPVGHEWNRTRHEGGRWAGRWVAGWYALIVGVVCGVLGCDGKGCASSKDPKASEAAQEASARPQPGANEDSMPAELPNVLLLTYAQFPPQADGRPGVAPGAARVEILSRTGGAWRSEAFEDAESNVFHKAFMYPLGDETRLVTLGGGGAAVKAWKRVGDAWQASVLWAEDFGGRFNRMRDAEVGTLRGKHAIAVGTHDQGVVAILSPKKIEAEPGQGDTLFSEKNMEVIRLDRTANTFVHEIELGDLDGNGKLEVYASLSEPNKLSGGVQKGTIVRYDPDTKKKVTVADLGDRHAKEILVHDVDGDGRDELYVAVEALTEGEGAALKVLHPVEILRFDAGTDPKSGVRIASLPDRQCRFLTPGDFNGDGRLSLVAAGYKSGLWLLEAPATPGEEESKLRLGAAAKQGSGEGKADTEADALWKSSSIDRSSSGFEHATLAADLDEDGKDELYVAADTEGELRRYVFRDGKPERTTILKHKVAKSQLTWNITAVPRSSL